MLHTKYQGSSSSDFSQEVLSPLLGPQGGGGRGTLIFSHIRRLGIYFWFKILDFNIFWGFQKNEFFFLGGRGV